MIRYVSWDMADYYCSPGMVQQHTYVCGVTWEIVTALHVGFIKTVMCVL